MLLHINGLGLFAPREAGKGRCMKNRIFGTRVCPSIDDWQALLCGDLPTGQIEELEAHLDGCPICVAQA